MKKALTRLAVCICAVLIAAEPALPFAASLLRRAETCGMACCRRARVCCCRKAKAHPAPAHPGWTAGTACAPGCGRVASSVPLPPVIVEPPVAGMPAVLTGLAPEVHDVAGGAAAATAFALFQRPPPRD